MGQVIYDCRILRVKNINYTLSTVMKKQLQFICDYGDTTIPIGRNRDKNVTYEQ